MEARLPWLRVERYSILNNPTNGRFYYDTSRALGTETMSTPGFVYCGKITVGFESATTGLELEHNLTRCYEAKLVGEPFEASLPKISAALSDAQKSSPMWRWLVPLLVFVFAYVDQKTKRAARAKEALRTQRKERRKQEQAAARERRGK